jgi:heat-inducible transcriptional repressor
MVRGDLEARVKAILLAVVEHYIHSGEPVGSRTLSKLMDLGVSAATIRNVMADLTEQGYLEQPHTSAGRVPTDQAYRFYVDAQATPQEVPEATRRTIEEAIMDAPAGLESLLASTTRLLAELTDFTGVIASPMMRATRLKKVEFLRIGPTEVYVVLITQSNMVHHKILRVTEELGQPFLNTVSRYLNDQFTSKSLAEIRGQVLESLMEEKEQYDQLLAHVVRLSKRAFDLSHERSLYVEGQFNIVKDLQDLGRVRSLLQALENKFSIIELLDAALSGPVLNEAGIGVLIGQENALECLEDCALVTAKYGLGNDSLGTIGVIGPTRMDYPRIVPIIGYTALVLSRAIGNQHVG